MSLMEKIRSLRGSGGGGGDSGGSFVQKPDNLRSVDTFEGLLGLCAGPIKGPVRGLKSVRINGTPIEAEDGTENFKGVTAILADGDPLKFPQIATLKLGSAGAPIPVGVDIPNPNPSPTPGDWVSRTVPNTDAEAIDLRFIVQQLYKQNKDGIFGNTASLEIEMKPTGTTTWINPFSANGNTYPAYNETGYDVSTIFGVLRYYFSQAGHAGADPAVSGSKLVITGKTTSAYVMELRVKVPNTGVYAGHGWDIRVRLDEPDTVDADPNFEKRTIQWESMTAVYTGQLGSSEDWRALAWLQLYGQATDNFNSLPTIDGIYDTKIVNVPPATVFDPAARTYTGVTWDGSWEKAFTTDPAWIINDAITDPISGIASFAPGAYLNKWDALELSKWCSEQVPDGSGVPGATHPRYSLGLVVDQAQKSDDLIRYLAGAVGAFPWDTGDGEWRIVVDKPDTPIAIFTHENIEGEFTYSHTDVDTRFNDVTVTFLNEEFDYREDQVRVPYDANIALVGRKPTKLVAVGCTNRQQALRWGVLRVRTNINEFRIVNFTTNRQGKYLERFRQILVADGSLNELADTEIRRTTGRMIENKGASIIVRDAMRLEIGVDYTLNFTVPNPAYNPEPVGEPADPTWNQPTITLTRTIMNDAGQRGDVTELFIDTALPGDVAENVVVALSATGLPAIPKVYRIIDLDLNDDGERVTITAAELDTGKWAAADAATDDNLQDVLSDTIEPPTAPAGMWTLDTFASNYTTKRVLTANWIRPDNASFDKYRLEYRFNEGPWQDLGYTRLEFYEMQEPQPGTHDLRVYAVSRQGFESDPLEGSYILSELPSSLSVSFGAATIDTHYDDTGATPQDLPHDELYKLSANGVELTADVTWDYRVVDGGVNTKTPASDWTVMSVTGGVGTFTISSVEVDATKVEVRGTTTTGSASKTVTINKILAPPSTGGSGSSSASQSSGFTQINSPWTSFIAISNTLTVTLGTGTTTRTTINLTCKWTPRLGQTELGPWNIEFKLQRNVGGTWTDMGSVQSSDPDPEITENPETGAAQAAFGTLSATINDTGLTAGNTYDYRVVARIGAASVNPANTGGIAFFVPTGGGVNITCP